ncbi:hypothetical protein ATP_00401 [Candidatus Phytoplasma mali]|uniref:Uncharacterized protein n=1 Tax=Phytoplasma mali (strain AT) TaxID=482235 RepID=B3QZI1_PHYMT|nr:hypothetical protein [Candidatus Phytoplasma mali]CAP18588.1 hypothetical protein ATP_00401 [Candidatus Phytoplasma mali]
MTILTIFEKILQFYNWILETYILLVNFYQNNNQILIRGLIIFIVLILIPYILNIIDFILGVIGKIFETIGNLIIIIYQIFLTILGIKSKPRNLVYYQNLNGIKFWFKINSDYSLTPINENFGIIIDQIKEK